ncbi:unnamed protein product [Angiostrongylus costaricensis]|uniref:Uncharacterized protein n=1 Tax=Angiostrongylus costaricensis TaxID=334426 RepID=A0A0R3PSE0_ANGCS|nr:unnamed protein product [Angiostrongylus costaricensis]
MPESFIQTIADDYASLDEMAGTSSTSRGQCTVPLLEESRAHNGETTDDGYEVPLNPPNHLSSPQSRQKENEMNARRARNHYT